MRIHLFLACYNDALFPRTGIAVTSLLERLGHQVAFPMGQTCCGQMHYNTGYHAEALPLVKRLMHEFRDAETIVVPSASCVAMMRDHYELMAHNAADAAMMDDVKSFLPRVFEFSELMTDRLGITDVGAYFPHRVTYHPSCHSLRLLHVGDRPIRLLQAVEGLEYAPMADADQCCGFGGTFAVKNAEVSSAMLADKIGCVRKTDAEFVAALDNSCLMQIDGGLHRESGGRGAEGRIRPVHLAEILNSTRDNPLTDKSLAWDGEQA
ncbi:MAG: (Fe-S)-binding protein [Janthinobacterium lividum]